MNTLRYIISIAVFFCLANVSAQNKGPYTDYKPVYEQWKNNYILDKIYYTDDKIVMYFRFVAQNNFTSAIFYGPGTSRAWYLNNKNPGKGGPAIIRMKALRNIRMNGRLQAKSLSSGAELTYPCMKGDMFTCEVHFDRPKNSVKKVDLVEGVGRAKSPIHFNCFNIKLKPKDSDELGDKRDMTQNIDEFTDRYKVNKQETEVKEKPKKTNSKPKIIEKKKPEVKEPEQEVIQETQPVIASKPSPPKPPKITTVAALPAMNSRKDLECGKQLLLSNIHFKQDNRAFKITKDAYRELHQLHLFLKSNKKARLTLVGHTDIFGDPEHMVTLSRDRVSYLRKFFIARGISSNRIQIEYHGLKRPINANGGKENRRVEVSISCME